MSRMKKGNTSETFQKIAEGYFGDYFDTGLEEYANKSKMMELIAIGKALIEIRDELRRMNNGNT